MTGSTRVAAAQTVTLAVILAGALLLPSGVAQAQAPAQAPAPAGGTKLISPVRGQAEIGYLTPVTKREGTMIVTTIKVKNMATAPIAGLKVDEFWYDKAGEPVTGAQPFRYRKPLMPGEVIDVVPVYKTTRRTESSRPCPR
jgi:hypothetical protein